MDCKRYREKIDLYLVDGLSEMETRELEDHLQACPECAAELAQIQGLIYDLAGLNEDVEAPPELLEGVLKQITGEENKGAEPAGGKKRPRWSPWKIAGTAVAGFAVLLVSGALILSAALGGNMGAPMSAGEVAYDDGGYIYDQKSSSLNGSSSGGGMSMPSAAPEMVTIDAEETPTAAYDHNGADMADGAERDTTILQEEQGGEFGLKIIRNARASLESDRFDEDMQALEKLVEEMGGYVTSRDISGTKLEMDQYGYGRYLYMQIRVPVANLDSFMESSGSIGVTRSSSIYEEDVSARYYDSDRRLKSYEAQHARILELMEKAETVEELIQIEAELTRLSYEIDSLKGELNYLDSRVNFSTINIDMQEVKRTESVDPSMGERMQNALANTFDAIKEGSKNLAVWLYGSLPYIGMWIVGIAIALLIAWLIVRRVKKTRKEKQGK